MWLSIAVTIATLLVNACSVALTATAIPATATPTIAVPAATATVAPTPTHTPTETPVPATATPLPPTATSTAVPTLTPTVEPPAAIIDGHVFRLEVAATSAERSRGLMGRESLAQGTAMLFVFNFESLLTFWMKDTLISLDILFLNNEQEIVNIQTMHPQPGAPTQELIRYESGAEARYAIEMNAGLAAEFGFSVGTRVELVLD